MSCSKLKAIIKDIIKVMCIGYRCIVIKKHTSSNDNHHSISICVSLEQELLSRDEESMFLRDKM